MENNNLTNNYSIGVVTYVNRYHTYFKKNIFNLLKYFPDKQIIVIINGHPNKVNNIAYLKEITQWLSSLNVQYITFEDHQPLAKCWNWLLLMSNSPRNLFLNDDILIHEKFRHDFENHLVLNNDFFAINNSFSHFILSKKIVKQVGWFDERFLGIGEEDGDYLMRMSKAGIELKNLHCRDIINFVAQGLDPSFRDISSNNGKYSSVNREFLGEKWFFNHINTEDFNYDIKFKWNDEEYLVKLKKGMETPVFYDFSLLDNDIDFAPKSRNLFSDYNIFKKYFKNWLNKIVWKK